MQLNCETNSVPPRGPSLWGAIQSFKNSTGISDSKIEITVEVKKDRSDLAVLTLREFERAIKGTPESLLLDNFSALIN